ncbi:hypothetical protein [Magnetofaba australis]|uniref:hypothetical protein n=1 Tax=Magnetofaba australis TaxID=1472297 RepID=UPI001301E996|nr:hypothetical protein [Magnetofaba australis]
MVMRSCTQCDCRYDPEEHNRCPQCGGFSLAYKLIFLAGAILFIVLTFLAFYYFEK